MAGPPNPLLEVAGLRSRMTSNLGEVRAHVDSRKLTELAQALVAVDTSYPPGNEAAVEGVLREALARWRPAWERVEPAPGRLSLIARLPPGDPGAPRPTLIVNGHTDVVPAVAAGWHATPSTLRSPMTASTGGAAPI